VHGRELHSWAPCGGHRLWAQAGQLTSDLGRCGLVWFEHEEYRFVQDVVPCECC
jgi:hypothetical protein